MRSVTIILARLTTQNGYFCRNDTDMVIKNNLYYFIIPLLSNDFI